MAAYYKFDEPGFTHLDSSPSRNYFVYNRYQPNCEYNLSNNFWQDGGYYNTSFIIKPGTTLNDLGAGISSPSDSTEDTVELWFNFPSLPTSGYQSILGVSNRALQCGFEIVYNVSGQLLWCNFNYQYQATLPLSLTTNIGTNVWTHIACVSSNNNNYMQLYMNGVLMVNIGYLSYNAGKKRNNENFYRSGISLRKH